MFISDSLEITDSVLAFDEIMEVLSASSIMHPEKCGKGRRKPESLPQYAEGIPSMRGREEKL